MIWVRYMPDKSEYGQSKGGIFKQEKVFYRDGACVGDAFSFPFLTKHAYLIFYDIYMRIFKKKTLEKSLFNINHLLNKQ